MTTSASSPATAPSHVPDLHINTTGASSITSLSSHHHHPYPTPTARSPHSTSGSPRSSGGGTGSSGGSGSTNQACAACKYQRRKCNPDCPLAPYFPADQQRRFLNAHRLFGVSNILKTLRRLRPELCPEAMGTLIYQAEMRAQDPVGGCYRFILSLERQLEIETAELSAVLHHLALYRQEADATAIQPPPGGMANLDVTSSNQPLLLNDEQEVVDALYTNHEADAAAILQPDHRPHDQGHSPQDQQHQQQLFDYFYYDATASDDASSKLTTDINLEGMQQFDFDAADQKVDLAPPAAEEGQGLAQQIDVNCQIDQKDYEIKAVALVDVFNMQQELQEVDVNANIDVNAVAVNPGVAVKHELQDEGARNNISAGEAAQKAAESSQCRLGLGFSSF